MRILGELKKLGFEVSKSTVRRYVAAGGQRPRTQSWATFIRLHRGYLREALALSLTEGLHAVENALRRLTSRIRHRRGSVSSDAGAAPQPEVWDLSEERLDDDAQYACRDCRRMTNSARDGPRQAA